MKATDSSLLDSKKKELVKLFLEIGALRINTQSPFVLASGKQSPIYFDHRVLMSLVDVRNLLADIWSQEVLEILSVKSIQIQSLVIAGTVSAGIAPAFLLADRLKVQFAYVRTAPKGHGTGKQWEGLQLKSGQTVLLLDDMITTGKSVAGAAMGVTQVCSETNANFLGVSCVTRHPFSQTMDFVSSLSQGKLFHSCFESTQIISLGEKIGLVSASDAQLCYHWLNAQEHSK
jgi:orotate phosphoribosyltransferase